ncbi:MAG: hypothetical protein Q7S37_02260 [bacterium]|nr:hypothetical protein [bacterium]
MPDSPDATKKASMQFEIATFLIQTPGPSLSQLNFTTLALHRRLLEDGSVDIAAAREEVKKRVETDLHKRFNAAAFNNVVKSVAETFKGLGGKVKYSD